MLGTENWIARGTVQRLGASLFALVCFCLAVSLSVAIFFVKAEVREDVGGGLGEILGLVLASGAFLGACLATFLAFRVVRGLVRSFRK